MSKYQNQSSEGRGQKPSKSGDQSNFSYSSTEENAFAELKNPSKSPSSMRKNLSNVPISEKEDDDFELFSASSNKGSTNNFLTALKKNNQPAEQKSPVPEKHHQTSLQSFLKKRVYISGDQASKPQTNTAKPQSRDKQNDDHEFDWKKDLDKILDDDTTKISFVARQISDKDFANFLENQQQGSKRNQEEDEESKGAKSLKEIRSKNSFAFTKKPSTERIYSRNKTSESVEESPIKEDKTPRREYSAYEDWRILDTIDQLVMNEGKTALNSRTLWATIKDPLTGRKLLDDKRSSESMRDRHKRYLSWLDDDAKERLEKFAKQNSLEDMKNCYCIIKKVDGAKKLVSISKNTNANANTEQGNHTSSNRIYTRNDEQKTTRFETGNLEEGFNDDDFAEQNWEKNPRHDEQEPEEFDFDFEGENSRTTKNFKPKSPPKSASSDKNPKNLIARMLQGQEQEQSNNDEEFEDIIYPTFGKQQSPSPPEFLEVSEDDEEIKQVQEQRKSKKRRREDGNANGIYEELILKKVKLTIDYDKKALCPSNVFQQRKPIEKELIFNENIMIYVDEEEENRDFIIEEPPFVKALKQLSHLYQVSLETLYETSRQVSDDLEDLEKYLQTQDPNILWNEEEDQDVLQNNQTALKYLRLLKGPERVQKRIQYLQEL